MHADDAAALLVCSLRLPLIVEGPRTEQTGIVKRDAPPSNDPAPERERGDPSEERPEDLEPSSESPFLIKAQNPPENIYDDVVRNSYTEDPILHVRHRTSGEGEVEEVHAVQLRVSLDEDHDTNVDENERAPRQHLKLRKKIREESKKEEAIEIVHAPSNAPIAPVKSGRLDEIRMRETIVRRAVQPAAREEIAPSNAPSLIAIDFVRSQDKSQQITVEGSSIIIRGIASGPVLAAPGPKLAAVGAIAPIPVRREARPVTVSVAIDGLVYAIRVSAGDTAQETAAALAERMSTRFSITVAESDDARARIVIGR